MSRAAASGSSACGCSVRDGPQVGQHVGWAWNRRSAGSSYSAAHGPHIGKPAMVVDGRSCGTSFTIVKRGPQFVQLMNGYR